MDKRFIRKPMNKTILALVKEILGYNRGKYSTVPIPDQNVTLNQADLLSAATAEKTALIERLRAYLGDMSKKSQLERRSQESDFRRQEINLYNISDYIGCMSKRNYDYLLENNKYINKNKVEINPNSINIKERVLVKNISKAFEGKVIIDDITAQFRPGICNLIIGTSGSGKTVLTKCIVDLIAADKGNIYFDGKELHSMSKEERKELRNNIGMLFQGNALFDSKTVEENVRFPLDMFTQLTLAEKNKTVSETLARVNLHGVNEKYPAEISGGMKKRVALARAIIMKPKYLFCDEPNSGLDPQTSMVIDKLIQDITTEFNITTIVVTHDMNSVMEIGNHIIYLHQGKKEWEGTNAEIIYSKNELLNNFIFASKFLQDAKSMRMTQQ